MSDIIVENSPSTESTVISNLFLDQYMPQANGEFVKVYLYLLRAVQSGQIFGLSQIADIFNCTERDVMRAFCYWEKMNLLKLTYENRKLVSLAFCPPPAPSVMKTVPEKDSPSPEAAVETIAEAAAASPTPESAVTPADADMVNKPTVKAAVPKRSAITAVQRKELQESEDVRQFLYIAEQYLERTLSKTDVDNLLYYYTELQFSSDLIEYLIEYCVSKGSRSTRYIETVALAWAQEGITTVKAAKASTSLYHKNYFTILKAMGIKSRNPVEAEIKIMDAWLADFTLDIISEACQRTILQTGQPSFQYADSILKDWKQKGVKHLADLEPLDSAHKAKAEKKSPTKAVSGENNKFSRYPHRQYDYDKINKSLFDQ